MVFHNISSKTRGNVFFRENHLELFLILHYDVDETLQKRGRQQVNKITETLYTERYRYDERCEISMKNCTLKLNFKNI